MHIARLFEEHNQNLLRFVTARLHSPQEAKEIAQEAYVRLLNLDEPNTVSYMRAYLFRIAANLVVDRLKQRERRSELRNLAFFDDDVSSPPPESILNARDELGLVQEAISELPPKCRKAFLLHKIHGTSIEKTSEEMKLSTRMVRLYVARAVAYCKERLDQVEAEGI
jgi:RNA polymerase sigma-70 factor (ECF subfamily)